jgi:hypothetical protein
MVTAFHKEEGEAEKRGENEGGRREEEVGGRNKRTRN